MIAAAKLRVALADDHVLVLEGLAALIRSTIDMDLVGQATTGARAYAMIRDLKPDITVLDICMPEMDGFAVAQRALNEGSNARLIGLSFNEDRHYFKHAMEVGLRGYVLKRSASENLLFAIRSVASGGFYIDPILAGQVMGLSSRNHVRTMTARSNASEPELTVREEEVLRLIALGFTIKEVAAQLGVTDKSIETYKARASEKLKLGSRARIVQYGMSQGWFQEAHR